MELGQLARSCCLPKQRPLLRSIFGSFIGLSRLWVNIRHRNKAACAELKPVQSSRSKSTTCPRKGSLLRFQSKSTATSDGSAQKAHRNSVFNDSESLATKICSQIARKWNVMFESYVATSWPSSVALSPSVHWHTCFMLLHSHNFLSWISSVAISRWQSC